jgi:hypothetical protein
MKNISQGSTRQIKAGQGIEWRGGLQGAAVSFVCLYANDRLDAPCCVASYFALLVEEEL